MTFFAGELSVPRQPEDNDVEPRDGCEAPGGRTKDELEDPQFLVVDLHVPPGTRRRVREGTLLDLL